MNREEIVQSQVAEYLRQLVQLQRTAQEQKREKSDAEAIADIRAKDPALYEKARIAKIASTNLEDVVAEDARRKGFGSIDEMLDHGKLKQYLPKAREDKGIKID